MNLKKHSLNYTKVKNCCKNEFKRIKNREYQKSHSLKTTKKSIFFHASKIRFGTAIKNSNSAKIKWQKRRSISCCSRAFTLINISLKGM